MLIALLVTGLLPMAAAGEFAVHRSGESNTLHDSGAFAVVTLSPFEDGVLNDGLDHYYLVRDESGQQVRISVHKNSPDGAVRIGFDDDNGQAAAVDPSESSVSLSPATLPADGISMAQVTMIPRDANGVPLGSGLDIQVDANALSPGFPCGPVIDRADGSYIQLIASSLPGRGKVWVIVEGVILHDEPTVVFEYAGGPGDLRELAKQKLDETSATGGAFDEALEVVDPGDPGADSVRQAWYEAIEGFEILSLDDYALDREAIAEHLQAAVEELERALDDPGEVDPEAILGLIDYLLDISRMIGQFHINRVVDACGPCDPDEGGRLCGAEEALLHGNEERKSTAPDYWKAAQWYGKAVDRALDAEIHCTGL